MELNTKLLMCIIKTQYKDVNGRAQNKNATIYSYLDAQLHFEASYLYLAQYYFTGFEAIINVPEFCASWSSTSN